MLVKLVKNKIDINQLCNDIEELEINEKASLKDIYSKWDELNNTERKQVGKVFNRLVVDGKTFDLLEEDAVVRPAIYCKK